MTLEEYIEFLEAQPETPEHPAKAAAVCMSAIDFGNMKTELETACRMLGNRCSYAVRRMLHAQ